MPELNNPVIITTTQEEIGEAVGLTHQAVSLKLQDLAKLPKLAKSLLDPSGKFLEVGKGIQKKALRTPFGKISLTGKRILMVQEHFLHH